MGIFDLIGDIVSLPLDVVADVSSAVQGKEVEHTKERMQEVGDDISDMLDFS